MEGRESQGVGRKEKNAKMCGSAMCRAIHEGKQSFFMPQRSSNWAGMQLPWVRTSQKRGLKGLILVFRKHLITPGHPIIATRLSTSPLQKKCAKESPKLPIKSSARQTAKLQISRRRFCKTFFGARRKKGLRDNPITTHFKL